jgi:hypothetical protein
MSLILNKTWWGVNTLDNHFLQQLSSQVMITIRVGCVCLWRSPSFLFFFLYLFFSFLFLANLPFTCFLSNRGWLITSFKSINFRLCHIIGLIIHLALPRPDYFAAPALYIIILGIFDPIFVLLVVVVILPANYFWLNLFFTIVLF